MLDTGRLAADEDSRKLSIAKPKMDFSTASLSRAYSSLQLSSFRSVLNPHKQHEIRFHVSTCPGSNRSV